MERNAIVRAVDKDGVTPTRVASRSQNTPVLHLFVDTLEHSTRVKHDYIVGITFGE
jgi:hypothetical protein